VSMHDAIFGTSLAVRYVAVYRNGTLESHQRPGIATPSAGESDKYEELIVNPTLITLLRQRGDIDCGGLDWVLVRYGHFVEFVLPLKDGHLSVGIEADTDVVAVARAIRALPALTAALATVRPN